MGGDIHSHRLTQISCLIVPLTGICGMWALKHRKETVEGSQPILLLTGPDSKEDLCMDPPVPPPPTSVPEAKGEEDSFDAYLLLSREGVAGSNGSTLVLETGEGLQEITKECPYTTTEITICAGNLFNEAGICQICPSGFAVFDGLVPIQEQSVQDILFSVLPPSLEHLVREEEVAELRILAAQVADPYVLLTLSNGLAVILEADPDSMMLLPLSREDMVEVLVTKPLLQRTPGHKMPPVGSLEISASCIYEDHSRWLERLQASHFPGSIEALRSATLQGQARPSRQTRFHTFC